MGDHSHNRQNLYAVLIVTWPNLISLARLISVPIISWLLLSGYTMEAFIVCVLAGLSDILDGFVARLLQTPSTVGAYLDPLADKVLLVGMFILLGYMREVELWLVLLVVFRDVLIIGGTVLLFMFGKTFEVKPLMISKVNTLLQIFYVVWLLAVLAFHLSFPWVNELLMYAVMASTILSGAGYVLVWLRYFAQNEEA
ncbi:MAG: CDP-alcohol phosphatidyltransferase family protein [Alphaproteobacteria bacterium]|nr:CDP-alcohol phosphatidyltransferase family protein [Alphaproteobacteria bacterium]